MKTSNILFLAFFSLIVFSAKAQLFSDDFTTSAGWKQYGTNAICSSSNSPGILRIHSTRKQLEMRLFRGSQTYMFWKDIGSPLQSTDIWRMEFVFTPTKIHPKNGAHFVLADDSINWSSEFTCGTPRSDVSSINVQCVGSNSVGLRINSKYQATPGSPSALIGLEEDTTYYVRLERLTDVDVILSVYSDPGRTNHIEGSPVCHTVDSRITDLEYFQATVGPHGSNTRLSNLNLDDLVIYDTTVEKCEVCSIEASMTWQDADNCPVIEFTNTSKVSTGATALGQHPNGFLGSIIEYGDGTFDHLDLIDGKTEHGYPANDFYDPCITTFSYAFDGDKYICCHEKTCYSDFFEDCSNPNINTSKPVEEEDSVCGWIGGLVMELDCNGKVNFRNECLPTSGGSLKSLVEFDDIDKSIMLADTGEQFEFVYQYEGWKYVCITSFAYFIDSNGEFDCCSIEKCDSIYVDLNAPCIGNNRIKKKLNEESFDFSPNPSKSRIRLSLKEGFNQIRIISSAGKLVYDKKSINRTELINLKELPNGIYIINVQNGDKIETKKFIKQ